MAIKLKVTEQSRKLQELVRGDVLFFPNSKRQNETIVIIDKGVGDLFTRRIRGDMEERIQYHLEKVGEDYVFNDKSEGFVYYTKRIGMKR